VKLAKALSVPPRELFVDFPKLLRWRGFRFHCL
jgi:hypothetical protein